MSNKNYLRDRTVWLLCREAGYQLSQFIKKILNKAGKKTGGDK